MASEAVDMKQRLNFTSLKNHGDDGDEGDGFSGKVPQSTLLYSRMIRADCCLFHT